MRGNGQGFIYVTDQSNNILGGVGWDNDAVGLARLQWEFLYRNPRSTNAGIATSFAQMTAVDAGGDNLTAFTINGVSQVNPASLPIAMVAGSITLSVTAIVNAMNAYTAPSPDDYRGFKTSAATFAISRILAGAAANGDAVSLTFDGDTVVTATDISGGSDQNVAPFKFWIDVSAGAVEDVLGPGAVDITDVASYQPLNTPTDIQTVAVSSNTITIHREVQNARVEINGVSSVGNANHITAIIYEGGMKGDVVTFCGIDGSPAPAVFEQGPFIPIDLPTISLAGYANTLTMSYDGSAWSQVVPSHPSVEYLRSQGQNLPIQPGVNLLEPNTAGIHTLHPGVAGTDSASNTYSQDIALSGSPITLTGDLEFKVDIDATFSNVGDSGVIYGNGLAITPGIHTVAFSDNGAVKATLPSELAASGLWQASWNIIEMGGSPNAQFSVVPVFDAAATGFITDSMVVSLDGAKLDAASVDGSTKLVDDSVTEVKLDTIVRAKLNVQGRNRVAISIPTAQVLTLNSVPVLAIPAPGANKVIKVESWTAKITYNSAAYATNVTLQLLFTGSGSPVASEATFLTRTANGTVNMPLKTNAGISTTQLLANTALYINVATGDPTAGNSDIVLYIDYSILDI